MADLAIPSISALDIPDVPEDANGGQFTAYITVANIAPAGSENLDAEIIGFQPDNPVGDGHFFLEGVTGFGAVAVVAPGSSDDTTLGIIVDDNVPPGDYNLGSVELQLTSDGTGIDGTTTALENVFVPVSMEVAAACYVAGTLIRTAQGEVPVERLAIGDTVITASDAARPIKWIGRRSYDGRFIADRKDILPVCIKAGALADNVPQRDLLISPHHAMFIDGVLIEAKDLINGATIVQAESVDQVDYFHIELETHDVIVAEGALSETFIDDDSRGIFHNACEYAALYRGEAPRLPRYCAPRCEDNYEVEIARRHIARRAGLADEAPRLGALHGCVDRVSKTCIAGWAQNADHPEAPVCLDICVDGRPIAQVLANTYREDLHRAAQDTGRHGFEFIAPVGMRLPVGRLEVRRSLDGAALPLSACVKRGSRAKRVRASSAA